MNTTHLPMTSAAPPPTLPTSAVDVTRAAAVIVIGLSALARALLSFQGYYLLDDYAFLGRAGRADALDISTLIEPHLGHLMPAAHFVVWGTQAVAPWNYALPAAIMALGWLGCLMLMYRILCSWLGRTPVILLPLTAFAIAPVTVQATTWWAAALNSIPLQLCALGGVLLLTPLAHGATRLSWRRQVGVALLTCAALAFFTKGVLLPVLFFGVAIAWSAGTWRHAAIRALRLAPALWGALAAIAVTYALTYATLAPSSYVPTGSAGLLSLSTRMGQSIIAGLIPSMIGGPVAFSAGADPLSAPPPWVIGLGLAALVGLIVGVARSTSTTRRLAGLCLVYAAGCIALIVLRQQGFTLAMAGAPRYFADLAIPATLMIASLGRDWLGLRPQRSTMDRWVVAGLVLVTFSTISLVTCARLIGNPYAADIRSTALASQESIASETESTVLDMWIPPRLLSPLFYGDYARSSVLFSATDAGPAFTDQATSLRLWTVDGRLRPARIEGPVAYGPAHPSPSSCLVQPGETTTLQLNAPVVPYTHAVEMITTSTGATSVQVTIGGGPPRTWMLPEGRATMYAWMTAGPTTEVVVVPANADSTVCVISVRIGAPVLIEEAS